MKYNIKDAKKFINSISNHKYEYLFKLAIVYGASRLELLNLQWKDIDFEKNTIDFFAVKYIKDNNYNYQWIIENKINFKRTFPLILNLKELLYDLHLKNKDKNTYVCVNSRGERLTANTIGRNLKQIIERNDLKNVSYSELKDSINDLLFDKSTNANYYQAWKRFDIIVRKQNIYKNINLSSNKKLARELNKFLTIEKYIFREEIEM